MWLGSGKGNTTLPRTNSITALCDWRGKCSSANTTSLSTLTMWKDCGVITGRGDDKPVQSNDAYLLVAHAPIVNAITRVRFGP